MRIHLSRYQQRGQRMQGTDHRLWNRHFQHRLHQRYHRRKLQRLQQRSLQLCRLQQLRSPSCQLRRQRRLLRCSQQLHSSQRFPEPEQRMPCQHLPRSLSVRLLSSFMPSIGTAKNVEDPSYVGSLRTYIVKITSSIVTGSPSENVISSRSLML